MKGAKQQSPAGRKRAAEVFTGTLDDLEDDDDLMNKSVLDVLMERREKILKLLARSVQGQIIYDACKNEKLFKVTYEHFCAELRRFRLLNEMPVRGGPTKQENEDIPRLAERYSHVLPHAHGGAGKRSRSSRATTGGMEALSRPSLASQVAEGL